jgi:hypothetical protein
VSAVAVPTTYIAEESRTFGRMLIEQRRGSETPPASALGGGPASTILADPTAATSRRGLTTMLIRCDSSMWQIYIMDWSRHNPEVSCERVKRARALYAVAD